MVTPDAGVTSAVMKGEGAEKVGAAVHQGPRVAMPCRCMLVAAHACCNCSVAGVQNPPYVCRCCALSA